MKKELKEKRSMRSLRDSSNLCSLLLFWNVGLPDIRHIEVTVGKEGRG
jgi:hypothetical protein